MLFRAQNSRYRIRPCCRSVLGAVVTILLSGCGGETVLESTPSSVSGITIEDNVLNVWWNRGYYDQEDEALNAIIAQWEAETGYRVNLYNNPEEDLVREVEAVLEEGNPPDIFFSNRIDETLVPRWAWDDQLADLSTVVNPLRETYTAEALDSVLLYNNTTQARSIYAVPLKQRTEHFHYWKDLLAEAGFSEADIPKEWDAFWAFWQEAQDRLRAKGYADLYALGLPIGWESADTYSNFSQALDIYDVELFDDQGQLRTDAPTRQAVAQVLEWYTQFYQAGYVPPAAENWTNSDNNTSFLNKESLTAWNTTLSIPGAVREDEEVYRNGIGTLMLPAEPDGEPIRSRVSIQQIVVFKTSPHPEMAQDFLNYLLQPDNLGPYLEGSLGRFFPVMPDLLAQPFWNNPEDPHVFVAAQQLQPDRVRLNDIATNPAYSLVQAENIWGRAMERVIVDKLSAQAATDEAFAQMAEIMGRWDS
ncbi:MAG: ABC transporter substrate-binding protein [Prochlorothrix sp.]|nr:ABC transporter substrate-binding protein [Prochlorothrix sp.]